MNERQALVRHAYRMLGSLADAEDIVQEAYLRWHAADRSEVRNPPAFLRVAVTRLCLDQLRSARRQRQTYLGPWLPEPLIQTDPAAEAELADDLSFAFLLALERLSPAERAAFLLHDVLQEPFESIAATLQRSPAAVKQLASRGRQKVRVEPPPTASSHHQAEVARRFALALRNDDLDGLRRLFSQDAVLLSDSGGKARAARLPVYGPERIAKFFLGISRKNPGMNEQVQFARINGMPGFLRLGSDGRVQQVLSLEIVAEGIRRVYITVNPDKLAPHRRSAFGAPECP